MKYMKTSCDNGDKRNGTVRNGTWQNVSIFVAVALGVVIGISLLVGCQKPWTFCIGDGTQHGEDTTDATGKRNPPYPNTTHPNPSPTPAPSPSPDHSNRFRPDQLLPLPPIPRPDRDREPRRDDFTASISSELGYSTAAIRNTTTDADTTDADAHSNETTTHSNDATNADAERANAVPLATPTGFFARNEVESWR